MVRVCPCAAREPLRGRAGHSVARRCTVGEQLSLDLRAAVVGEGAAVARAVPAEQPRPWWDPDRAMLDEHPPYRDPTKDERRALGAVAGRISASAVRVAELLVASWPEPIEWPFARLLAIHAFYAELAGAAGMRVVPAYLGALPSTAEAAIREATGWSRGELGAEHLGAVQETLMGYGLTDGSVVATTGRRKGGIHFTPYDLALKVTLRTLEPLLRLVPPEHTLDLRICDPAVGGGVFLLAVVRVLAPRVLRAGRAQSLDEAKRLVALHCCYGVDRAVAAVMTTKLALTLECRAAHMPGDWLDGNVKHGDALVGLSLDQLARFGWRPDGRGSELIRSLVDRAMNEGAAARQAQLRSLSSAAR